jgi:Camelysin metallo-endopeptidase
MKKFTLKKKMIAGAAAGALVLGVAGGAFAFWTQNGSGPGSASTGTTTGITVNEVVSASNLYPGGPAQSLSGDFTSTNPGTVSIGAVTASLGTLPSGCVAADFTIDNSASTNSGTVASGTHQGAWSGITIKMNNTAANQDGCKSSTIPLAYAVAAS